MTRKFHFRYHPSRMTMHHKCIAKKSEVMSARLYFTQLVASYPARIINSESFFQKELVLQLLGLRFLCDESAYLLERS